MLYNWFIIKFKNKHVRSTKHYNQLCKTQECEKLAIENLRMEKSGIKNSSVEKSGKWLPL